MDDVDGLDKEAELTDVQCQSAFIRMTSIDFSSNDARVIGRATYGEDAVMKMVAAARRHRVLPLVARSLHLVSESEPDGAIARQYRRLRNQVSTEVERLAARNREQRHALAELSNRAKDAGVKLVVLKGPAYADHLYPPNIIRPMGDIDLFTAEKNLSEIDVLLKQMGYRQITFDQIAQEYVEVPQDKIEAARLTGRHAVPYRRVAGDMVIEFEAHAPFNDENFHFIDTSSMLDNAVPMIAPDFRKLYRLDPVDELIYMSANIHKNLHVSSGEGALCYPRLGWYCDIREMLRHFSEGAWSRLWGRADTFGMRPAVLAAIRDTGCLFPEIQFCLPEVQSQPNQHCVRTALRERIFEPFKDVRYYRMAHKMGLAGGVINAPRLGPGRFQRCEELLTHVGEIGEISGTRTARWQYFGTHVAYGEPPGSDIEFSGKFAIAWRDDYLHFDVDVSETNPKFNQKNGYYFEQSCAQLLFYDEVRSRLVSLLLVPKAADLSEPAVLKHASRGRGIGVRILRTAAVEASISDTGYRLIGALPLDEVMSHTSDRTVRFDVALYRPDPSCRMRRTVLQWSSGGNNIRYPGYFGTLRLIP